MYCEISKEEIEEIKALLKDHYNGFYGDMERDMTRLISEIDHLSALVDTVYKSGYKTGIDHAYNKINKLINTYSE